MQVRTVRLGIIVVASALAACGGGGGGGGGVAPGGNSGSGGGAGGGSNGGGSGNSGGNSGSSWVSGQFAPAINFEDRCEVPRTGNSPSSGQPYPDIQGATVDENNWIRAWSNETYLWYDEITDRDPAGFQNAIAYFDTQKTFELSPTGAPKDKFHFTYDTADWIALSQSGVSVGYGITWAILVPVPPRDIAVAYADPGTPAGNAGLAHGDRLISVDGIDVIGDGSVAGTEAINDALYPSQSGRTHDFEFENLETLERTTVRMTAGEVTSAPVLHTQTVESPGGATIGYLLFNDHIATAEQALIDAVETLEATPGGIDDLVLDIRYNGGGFLAIASQLAYMIAGPDRTAGRTFEVSEFNDKNPTINPVTGNPLQPLEFIGETIGLSAPATSPPTALPSLDLQRVFVLTGSRTCSASEAVINGLRGIGIEVIQIGETTCGKPYGFYPTDNCGTTYFSVQFRGVNDAGFGDYTDGFTPADGAPISDTEPPGCIVPDDFEHRFGDPAEARLATALYYRDNGICPSPAIRGSGLLSKLQPTGAAEPIISKPEGLMNRIVGH